MIIQIDSREQKFIHVTDAFDRTSVKWFVSKLVCGDYASLNNPCYSIDRKNGLQELCGNVCQQHERFRNELLRAQDLGIQLVILCEHSTRIKSLAGVKTWINPRLRTSPCALNGEALYTRLLTMSVKYNVPIYFCDKAHTGQRIIELLQAAESEKQNGIHS